MNLVEFFSENFSCELFTSEITLSSRKIPDQSQENQMENTKNHWGWEGGAKD